MFKFASMALTGMLTANASYRTPGDYECILWECRDYNCDNISVSVDPNTCNSVVDVHAMGFDNVLSSFACGKKVKFDFCNNWPDDDCYKWNGEHGAGPSKSHRVGREDKLTTWKG
jgi:hypothetical protein